MIPDNWSIGLLHGFVISSARKSINHARTTRIERMLARGENLQVQSENIGMMGEQVTMTESKYVSRISFNLRFIHTSDCLLDDFDCE